MEEPLINELLLVGAALGSAETLLAEDGRYVMMMMMMMMIKGDCLREKDK